MAEDKDEDLSMEDILSSIKNILVEDEEGSAPVAPQPQATVKSEPVAAAPVFNVQDKDIQTDEDILELSPEMRIDTPVDELSATNAEEKLETAAAQDESILAADDGNFNFEEILNSNNELLSSLEADDTADPIYTPEDDNAGDYGMSEAGGDPNLTSDPFYEELPDLQNISSQYEAVPEVEVQSEIEVEAEELPALQTEVEVIPEIEVEAEELPVAPAEPKMLEEPATDTVWEQNSALAPAQKEPIAPVDNSDAVDVSANIISNFAKMFSAQEENASADAPSAPVYEPAVAATKVGNGSKTIEDMVHEVIRETIAADVIKDIHNKADFEALAKAEIAAQTRQWLNANLPAVVERIVKQEIERVMAKVGS